MALLVSRSPDISSTFLALLRGMTTCFTSIIPYYGLFYHLAVIDAINGSDDTTFQREQDILDEHDEEISALAVRLQKLIATCSTIADPDIRKIPSRRLTRLGKSLS